MIRMVASMTAFAEIERDHWVWEIRTVNHRFLEFSFRMPNQMLKLERQLRDIAKSKLHRGKIDATLRYVGQKAEQNIQVNEELLAQILNTVSRVRLASTEEHNLDCDVNVDLMDLLRWPGVLNSAAVVSEEAETAVLAGFNEALTLIRDVRTREGKDLDDLFKDRLDAIKSILGDIQFHSCKQIEFIRQKLMERINRFNVGVDEGRIAQEVAIAAQKADIDEECDRLRMHIGEFEKCLETPGPLGRRMGFLVQEMAREANTLAAKTVLQECINSSVELKVFIDQIREQVQNVE